MQTTRQLLWGLLIAVFSSGIILGGFSLSLAEGEMAAPIPTSPPFTPSTEMTVDSVPPTVTTNATTFVVTPPTDCPSPAGWLAYLIQPGDTLDELAAHYRISTEQLSQANCLMTVGLMPGAYLYVPPVPTRTPIPCGSPPGWIRYTILKGDTLYSLAQYYQVTVKQLQQANCMGGSTSLYTGRQIYVPPKPTRTPSPTPTSTSTVTPIPSEIPSETPSPMPTDTPIPATP